MRDNGVAGSKAPSAKPWTRRRLGFASVGALVGSSALVVAAILGIEAAAPNLPAMGTRVIGPPILRVTQGPVSSENGMGGVLNTGHGVTRYEFTAASGLSTTRASARAYELASPKDLAAATGKIARALGLPDTVTYLGPNNYNGGTSSGPDVTVDTVSGVLNWLYPTWTGTSPQTIPVNPSAPLPTDTQAISDAEQLLQAAGISADQLGVPLVSRYAAGVNVAFQFAAGGLPTDQEIQVEYGPGSTVLTASGIIASATPLNTYPTIAPTEAVELLANQSGPVQGASHQSIVSVRINRASMVLSMYTLAGRRYVLLPTWSLTGTQGGSGGTTASDYSGSILAIPAKFIRVSPAP